MTPDTAETRRPAEECPTCGAPVSPFVTECPFCGADVTKRSAMRARRLRWRSRLRGTDVRRMASAERRTERQAAKAERRAERAERRHSFAGASFPGLSEGTETPWAVGGLLLANIFGFIAFHGSLTDDPGALDVSQVKDGEWWRLLSYQFLHSGLLELIFSLLLLGLFATLVERRYGHLQTLLIYLLSGIGGGLVAVAINSGVVSAGSTVSTFGLMGAWLVAISRPEPLEQGYPLRAGLLVTAILLLYGAVQPGIDVWAQVGGLATGAALAALLELGRRRRATA